MKKNRCLWLPLASFLTIGASSCSFAKGLETDLGIVAMIGEETYFTSHVNIFNNAILPMVESSYVPIGSAFLGWALPGWSFGIDDNNDLYKGNGVVRYLDVKDYASNNVVKFSSVIVPKESLPKAYFTLGWYDKVATSGLDSERMANFIPVMKNYLRKEGASQNEIDSVVVRGYQGAVADIGAAINADGDVDLLLGIGNNIDSIGNVHVIEKMGGITMGGKKRYIARLTDNLAAIKIYSWLQGTDAQNALT